MKLNLSSVLSQVEHFGVTFVSTLVPQVVAVQGHVTRDFVLSAIAGAAVAAYHTVFPKGLVDVEAAVKADVTK